MISLKKYFGPSTLVAAAFIGPGTLTTCTMAGVESGYTLLWAMLFSVIATIILQEMSARLGFLTREGLGEALNHQFPSGISKWIVFFLVISAILIGNAAYESGNLSGGIMGFELLLGEHLAWPLILGILAFILMFFGKYKWVEKILIGLVIVMSLCFLITAIIVQPDLSAVFSGFVPGHFKSHYLLIMGLIGTTVVPYNLFLHASTISKKYDKDDSLKDIRIENNVSIILGGTISMLIIITAAASADQIDNVTSAKDLALQLEPLFGNHAKSLMGIGLIAAGFSSALTAPLAAAYAIKGLFRIDENEDGKIFRLIWIIVLLTGVIVSMSGIKPILIIKFAQIMNAILLPFVAVFLVWICNKQEILGSHQNKIVQNIAAVMVLILTSLLSIKTLSLIF
ncbi:MAG: Nramp family divalent metal transporter [Saprospiraceae bacterium]|nr:Nramp family divalent metal transporter [Saprospiraceae bacterium]